jgi:Amt family ammonium transporter
MNQLGAVAVTWIFAIVGTVVIAKITDAVIGLRVSPEEEMAGLDQSQHGESGYNLEVESL